MLINEIIELAGEFGLEKLIAEVHLQAQGAFNAFKKAGFSVKAVFEDLVKDPAGNSSDLIVMICLGTLLINEIVELAGEFGLEKLIAEIHFQAVGAFNAFKNAGFSVKAIFEDLVKDPAGKSSDLVVMICDVQARDK